MPEQQPPEVPDIEQLRLIDMMADRFEAEWLNGSTPRIEDFLSSCPPEASQRLLSELLTLELEWHARLNQPVSSEVYTKRFPEYSRVVESVFDETTAIPQQPSDDADAQAETTIEAAQSTLKTDRSNETASNSLDSTAPNARNVSEFPIPQQIGRYELLGLLGAGAMGAVYLAQDKELHRRVAIKVCKLDCRDSDADRIARFQREARAAAALHHPNICPVYDVGNDGRNYFITMACLEGRTLQDVLSKQKRLSQPDAATIVRTLARALQCAHDAGVIHRDLKPANIMLDRNGDPIIMDFGLALLVNHDHDARITQDGMIVGSSGYMPPEQVSGDANAASPASDIYSLGVILYELLSGRLPYLGRVMSIISQIRTDDPPSLRSLQPDIAPGLEAIVARMMARSPKDRYGSMQAVADALGLWLKDESGLPDRQALHPTVAVHRRQASIARRWLLLSVIAIPGVILLAMTFVLHTRQGDVRIEVSDERIGVELDGNRIVLTDNLWQGREKSGAHQLSAVVNGTLIPIGQSLPIQIDGGSKRLRATLGNIEMTSSAFNLQRGDNASLTIELVPIDAFPGQVESTPTVEEFFERNAVFANDTDWFRGIRDGALTLTRKTKGAVLWRETGLQCALLEGMYEVDMRAYGEKGSWLIQLVSDQSSSTVCCYVDQGQLKATLYTQGDSQFKVSHHTFTIDSPIQPDGAFSRVHLLVRRRSLTLAINGVRIGTTLDVPFDLTPGELRLGATGGFPHTLTMECDRFAFYPLIGDTDQQPAVVLDRTTTTNNGESRPSVLRETPSPERLLTLAEAVPVCEDSYDVTQLFLEDRDFLYCCQNGRLVLSRKTARRGGGWWGYHRMDYDEGLIDVDVKLLGTRGGWLLGLHNPDTNQGARVWIRDGDLRVGPSVWDPHQTALSKTLERVVSTDLPLHTDIRSDRVQLLVRKRSVCVYINGRTIGAPTTFPYDITPGSLRLGVLGSDLGSTRVEYESATFRRLK